MGESIKSSQTDQTNQPTEEIMDSRIESENDAAVSAFEKDTAMNVSENDAVKDVPENSGTEVAPEDDNAPLDFLDYDDEDKGLTR